MLVRTRQEGELLTIGDGIVVHVLEMRVRPEGTSERRIGIEAPRYVLVLRTELLDRVGCAD